jgi:LAO/AO transport system kinase
VLVPGAGDDVQALKAGVMEIADVFVVNKADRPDADRVVEAVESSLALRHYDAGEWRPPVLKTEAVRGIGVDELWAAVGRCRDHRAASGTADRAREQQTMRVRDALARRAADRVAEGVPPEQWARVVDQVVSRDLDPDAAADRLLALAFGTGKGGV